MTLLTVGALFAVVADAADPHAELKRNLIEVGVPASVDPATAEWYQSGNPVCFAADCPHVTVNYTGPPMSKRAAIASAHEHLVAQGYRQAFDWGWGCGSLQYDGDSFKTNECGSIYRHPRHAHLVHVDLLRQPDRTIVIFSTSAGG